MTALLEFGITFLLLVVLGYCLITSYNNNDDDEYLNKH